MTNTITFRVFGEPAPKGSKRHVGNGRLIESSKKLPAWMRAVKQEATKNRPSEPIDGRTTHPRATSPETPNQRVRKAHRWHETDNQLKQQELDLNGKFPIISATTSTTA